MSNLDRSVQSDQKGNRKQTALLHHPDSISLFELSCGGQHNFIAPIKRFGLNGNPGIILVDDLHGNLPDIILTSKDSFPFAHDINETVILISGNGKW